MNRSRHHFVPKVYLKQFSNCRNGFLEQCLLRTEKKSIRRIHVNNTCFVYDFYDLDDQYLKRYKLNNAEILERDAFRKYENNFENLIQPFVSHSPEISANKFIQIIEGYLFQKHRTPYYRKEISRGDQLEKSIDSVLRDFQIEYTNHPIFGHFTSDEYAENFRAEILSDKDQPAKIQKLGLVESYKNMNQAVTQAIRKLLTMKLTVVEAPVGEYFLTSDNPGFTLRSRTDRRFDILNTNFGVFHSVTYPISSKQALVFSHPNRSNYYDLNRKIQYLRLPNEVFYETNFATASVCDEKILCENREYLEEFVRKYRPN